MSRIKVRRYRIEVPERAGKPEKPFKIVIFGDLHNKCFGEGNQKLVAKIAKEQPDLIFCVGDITIVRKGKPVRLEVGIRLLKRLAMECPVYCVLGNHEYRAKLQPEAYKGVYEKMKRHLNHYQIHLLEDEKAMIEMNGTRLSIFGFELPMNYYKRLNRKKISRDEIAIEVGWIDDNRYNMLLTHNPAYAESYLQWGADFTCCGHFHGGIIRLPFLGGVISPQFRLFPRYCCGLYKKEEKHVCVTAGLGTHSSMPRINNPAEFSVVEFY